MSTPRQQTVVIGVGNEYRRDDGVGPAVVARLAELALPGLALAHCDGELTQLLDAWAGAALAVVVDAVLCEPRRPGRLHRTALASPLRQSATSTHGLGIPEAVGLADALELAPQRLVVYAVEAEDVGFGLGLTDAVRRAVPHVVRQVIEEVGLGSGQH